MKELLCALFAATLRDLDPGPRVAAAVRVRAASFAGGRVRILAIGKAARAMATAAVAELRARREPGAASWELALDGLLVPPAPDDAPLPPLSVVNGGHPLPTQGSLDAGARALDLCRTADGATTVLVLLSGGASALCELPIDATVSLPELRTLYQALVGCGAGIADINVVRKHLSAVKGGRLAAAAAGARAVLTLAVSDVPGDAVAGDLAALASGPTLGDRATVADCRRIVDAYGLQAALPRAFAAALAADTLPPLVRPDDPRLARTAFLSLLDNATAVAAIAGHATAASCAVTVVRDADELEVTAAAELLLARLRALAATQPGRPVAIVAGGEVRVALPPDPGVGGRNQQFALACALRIAGEPIAVLSAGTDGVDGNSPAAGAVADGTTLARAAAMGFDAQAQLRRCDAFPLFAALGDAVVTGATGTNVRDLRVLVRWAPDGAIAPATR